MTRRGRATASWIVVAVAASVLAAAAEGQPLELTVRTAVLMAMEHNETLSMAATDLERSRQRLREIRADGLPNVQASVGYTRNWLLPTAVFGGREFRIGNENSLVGALRLRQPLYTGGRVSGTTASARQQVVVSDQLERLVRQQVAFRVENALYGYLLAREMARVSQSALARARANAGQVTALRRAGRASQYETMRASVQVTAAESDSIQRAHGVAVAEIDLKDAIGISLDRPVLVAVDFRTGTRLALDDVESLVRHGLAQRSERHRLEALLRVTEGSVRAARAGGRPSLDLVAASQLQYQKDQLGDLASADEWHRSWSTGLALEVPIFDGLRSRARVAQARQELRRLELEVEQVERGIERDVRQAWMAAREASERLRAREGSVAQAEKGLADAESRFRAGSGTQLEVLDAQLALAQAESEYVRARHDRAVALVALELSTGVLGEASGEATE